MKCLQSSHFTACSCHDQFYAGFPLAWQRARCEYPLAKRYAGRESALFLQRTFYIR
jgi:hypothetical protein